MSEHITNEIPEVEPEHEPEYVGAHSGRARDYCSNWVGDSPREVTRCDEESTHTVVMRSPNGELSEIAMCDECGEPQDVQERFK